APIVASTLSVDPMEVVAGQLGATPGFFQLYTPTDRRLAESFVQRAETAGFKAIVVTLDTWVTGWRPRDLSLGSFPQLHGLCLANYFSDALFRARLGKPPELCGPQNYVAMRSENRFVTNIQPRGRHITFSAYSAELTRNRVRTCQLWSFGRQIAA